MGKDSAFEEGKYHSAKEDPEPDRPILADSHPGITD